MTVAALAYALTPTASARSSQAPAEGLSVSPDKFEIDSPDRSVDLSFTISSNARDAVPVSLTITRLEHDLDGAPRFPDGPVDALRVEPARATVMPGSPLTVRVTGAIPADATALYAGVVATIDRPPTAGVDVVTRVGVPLLLRGPQPWHPAVAIEQLALSGDGSSPGRVEAVIRNTGDVHVKPRGTFTISSGSTVVATASLVGETVLPGLARRMGASWTVPSGLAGPLTVRLDLDDPAVSAQRDDVGFPAPASLDAESARPDDTHAVQQPFGGRGPSSDRNLIVVLVAVLLIVAVATGAVLFMRRSPGRRRVPP